MIFNRYLFLWPGGKEPRPGKIRKLKAEHLPAGSYVLLVPDDGPDVLEIMQAALLKLPVNRDSGRRIVGIARTKEEACDLASAIAAEVYRETGGTDVLSYLDALGAEACP